jgi:hypothetical protein
MMLELFGDRFGFLDRCFCECSDAGGVLSMAENQMAFSCCNSPITQLGKSFIVDYHSACRGANGFLMLLY